MNQAAHQFETEINHVKKHAFVITISYPSLRPKADATYAALSVHRMKNPSELGSCIDKNSAPDENTCDTLIDNVKQPQSLEDISAFFDLPGAKSASKMLAPCDET